MNPGPSKRGGLGPLPRPSVSEALLLCVLLGMIARQRWIMDDATIYFRYVDNWVLLGRGLVFNAGEYVEGFTSPLWLLLLAGCRALLPLDYYRLSLAIGLLCGLLSGVGCLVVGRHLAPGRAPASLPLALMAGHYGTQTHFTSGLETPLVQLYGVVTALWVLWPQAPALQLALALAPLVRPELALVTVAAGMRLLWIGRRVPWRLVVATLLLNGGWLLFRIYYYADLLPNTFYLKDGTHWGQGLIYLLVELQGGWGVLLSVAVVGVLARLHGPLAAAGHPRIWMLGIAALVSLWIVRIGGDMGYHRFLAFPFCLSVCASAGLLEQALEGRPAALRPLALGAALALALCSYPFSVLSEHPLRAGSESLLYRGIEDAMWHRRYKSIRPDPGRAQQDRELRARYRALPDPQHHHARAVRAFCRWAYVRPDTHVINTYGLTDAILSRVDSRTLRPGHRDLRQHSRDLLRAQLWARRLLGRGVYRAAARRGGAAPWLRRALPTIEQIERRMYNRHDFVENLRLVMRPVPRIPP